ncbi:MAG: hypothetical protein ACLGH3_00030 [Actinomycetota bacterium]
MMRRRLTMCALALACLASAAPAPASSSSAPGLDDIFDAVGTLAGQAKRGPLQPIDLSQLTTAKAQLGLDDVRLDRWLVQLPSSQREAVAGMVVAVSEATLAVRDALSSGRTIDQAAITAAGLDLVRRLGPMRTELSRIRVQQASCFGDNILCVGTEGDDRWEDEVQILIDPAGDDTYLNNAGGTINETLFPAAAGCTFGGGTTGRAAPNLGCTATPSTVCTYDTANRATDRDDLPVVGIPGHTDPGQGDADSGSCGSDERFDRTIAGAQGTPQEAHGRLVSVALDLDGSDTYLAPWSHEDPLFDLLEDCFPGDASKVNTNRDFVQGSALGGIGILWDDGDGNDNFRGRLNSQGSGHVGGFGALLTTGRGDATFWADRLSQGNGIGGGVGVLANLKDGAQAYLLDPPEVYRNEFSPNARGCQQEGRAGQGQGGFGGIGVLATLGGSSSTYRAVTHVTEEAFPYSPVLDADGEPALVPGTDAQGSGESFPISATMGGVVLGAGLLVDDTAGDSRTCAQHRRAGMVRGSTTSVGEDLSTIGLPDRSCGAFNTMPEFAAGSLGEAIGHLLGGAVGVRVVL